MWANILIFSLENSKIIYKIHGTRDFVASIVARVLESPASARDLKLKRLRASRGSRRVVRSRAEADVARAITPRSRSRVPCARPSTL